MLLSTAIVCKYPPNPDQDDTESAKFVAWHQDLKYWGIRPLEEVTVWIAVDNTHKENAGMRFLPGKTIRHVNNYAITKINNHGDKVAFNNVTSIHKF